MFTTAYHVSSVAEMDMAVVTLFGTAGATCANSEFR